MTTDLSLSSLIDWLKAQRDAADAKFITLFEGQGSNGNMSRTLGAADAYSKVLRHLKDAEFPAPITMNRLVLTFGSDPSNMLVIDALAKFQGEVHFFANGSVRVYDFGSRQGTFLVGAAVIPVQGSDAWFAYHKLRLDGVDYSIAGIRSILLTHLDKDALFTREEVLASESH